MRLRTQDVVFCLLVSMGMPSQCCAFSDIIPLKNRPGPTCLKSFCLKWYSLFPWIHKLTIINILRFEHWQAHVVSFTIIFSTFIAGKLFLSGTLKWMCDHYFTKHNTFSLDRCTFSLFTFQISLPYCSYLCATRQLIQDSSKIIPSIKKITLFYLSSVSNNWQSIIIYFSLICTSLVYILSLGAKEKELLFFVMIRIILMLDSIQDISHRLIDVSSFSQNHVEYHLLCSLALILINLTPDVRSSCSWTQLLLFLFDLTYDIT